MTPALLIIWPVIAVCSALLFFGPRYRAARAFDLARRNGMFLFLRMPFAILAAAFAAPLLPAELIAEWLGHSSGWSGILLATIAGAFVPSGPMLAFPLVLALFKAGVGMPQLIAFLTSWSMLAITMAISWEAPLLGWQFTTLRYAVSIVLPPLAGGLAALIAGV